MTIKELRKSLGLTQVEFAHHIGVHPITVSRWERGLFSPNKWVQLNIKKLEKKLGKSD